MYSCVGVYHIIVVFTSCFTQHMVDTRQRDDVVSVWGDYDNVIILNVYSSDILGVDGLVPV